MTNDEFQMTNQIRNPNSEAQMKSEIRNPRPKVTSDRRFVRISGFGFLSDFVLRISSLSRASSRRLLQSYERPEIRFSPIAEEPWLHRRRRAHARARHW